MILINRDAGAHSFFWVALALALAVPNDNAHAVCLDPPGKITATGTDGTPITNVVDVQCVILMVLWSLGGQIGDTPTCLAVPGSPAIVPDHNCDGVISVSDVIIATQFALASPLNEGLDANENDCVDACETDIDGDGDFDLTDCAPLDALIYTGATEACNGYDDSCNGKIDESGAAQSCDDGQLCNGAEACDGPPTPTGVKFSEFFFGTLDWFELYNGTTAPVNLNGWKVEIDSGQGNVTTFVISPGGAQFIPAATYFVVTADPALSGVLAYTTAFDLPSSGTVRVHNAAGNIVSQMSFGSAAGSAFQPQIGAATALTDPTALVLNAPELWQPSIGTPKAPNSDVALSWCIGGDSESSCSVASCGQACALGCSGPGCSLSGTKLIASGGTNLNHRLVPLGDSGPTIGSSFLSAWTNGTQVRIRRLSSDGTFLDGDPVIVATPSWPLDIVAMSDGTTFVFIADYSNQPPVLRGYRFANVCGPPTLDLFASMPLPGLLDASAIVLSDGNVLVVASAFPPAGGGDTDLLFFRFTPCGEAVDPTPIFANGLTLANEFNVRLAESDAGTVFVAWRNGVEPRGRVFDSTTLMPLSEEMPLGNATSDQPGAPPVTAIPGIGFAVTWACSIDGDKQVCWRRFGVTGTPIDATEMIANNTTQGAQTPTGIIAGPNGLLLVTYYDANSPCQTGCSNEKARGRFLGADGSTKGSDFILGTSNFSGYGIPAYNPFAGQFMVAYTTATDPNANGGSVYVQAVASPQ